MKFTNFSTCPIYWFIIKIVHKTPVVRVRFVYSNSFVLIILAVKYMYIKQILSVRTFIFPMTNESRFIDMHLDKFSDQYLEIAVFDILLKLHQRFMIKIAFSCVARV